MSWSVDGATAYKNKLWQEHFRNQSLFLIKNSDLLLQQDLLKSKCFDCFSEVTHEHIFYAKRPNVQLTVDII